jgi:uncharacterized protein (TIGR02186 family)
MRRILLALFATLAVLEFSAAPGVCAERLVASLSNHRVMVTSNFTGDEVVLFGAVEHDASDQPRSGSRDIVVTVTGPRQNLVTFRKDRVLGIWVNVDSRVFEDAPAYLAVLSNRPLEAVAHPETLRRLQVGLANVVLLQRAAATIADSDRNDPFRTAFIDLRSRLGLYREQTDGVTFLTSDFFRASIPLPAEAPVGEYQVDVRLFSEGAVIARTNTAFEVYKSGFERAVSVAARDHGFLYGLATALMALATGWFASVVFRRD